MSTTVQKANGKNKSGLTETPNGFFRFHIYLPKNLVKN